MTKTDQDIQGTKVRYIGEPVLTRADYGESVRYGVLNDGAVYVFDCAFGLSFWSLFDDQEWEIVEDDNDRG